MKDRIKSRINCRIAYVGFFLLLFAQMICFPNTVHAQSDTYYKTNKTETAYANIEFEKKIKITSEGKADLWIETNCNCDLDVQIYNSKNKLAYSYNIPAEKAKYDDSNGGYIYERIQSMKSGTYVFKFCFSASTHYNMNFSKYVPKLNKSKATLESGKTTKLSVSNEKVSKWTSSNEKVATVKGGKVTAKGAGTATITATLKDGKKLTCKITVKAVTNIYSVKKLTLPETSYGRTGQVYEASYSGSSLKLKVRLFNHTEFNYTAIKDLTIVLKQNDVVIGELYKDSIDAVMKADSTKDLTFTIINPYDTKADLRKITAEVQFSLGSK